MLPTDPALLINILAPETTTMTTETASHLRIELRRAQGDELAADARWTTALCDLENAAAERMPADTLMRRVAKVAEAEFEARAAKQRVELLIQFRDDA